MIAIFKREFRSYMNNVIGYAVIAFVLICAGLTFTYQNLTVTIDNIEDHRITTLSVVVTPIEEDEDDE